MRKLISASLIAGAILASTGSILPASASAPPCTGCVKIVSGTVQTYGVSQPEEVEFIQGGCHTNITAGTFAALINIKPYAGMTLYVTADGATTDLKQQAGLARSPSWFNVSREVCNLTDTSTSTAPPAHTGSPSSFAATKDYVKIEPQMLDDSALQVGEKFTLWHD